MANILQTLEAEEKARLVAVRAIPNFQPGDTLRVNVKIKEGERERVQAFEGVCIARAGGGVNENFTVRKPGDRVQLGVSQAVPMGVRGVENVVLTRSVGGALTEGVDYEVDAENGMVVLNDEGSVAAGDVITATYDVAASTFERIISRTASVRCAFKFITKNLTGQQKVYFAPCVVLRPSGDITMITEDNLAELQFTLSVEKLPGLELMYVDGKPFTI